MQSISWRSTHHIRNQLFISVHLEQFHSTPVTLAKWKSKWDCKDDRKAQKPSKIYMRYAVRQQRAEAKKALKNYLLYGKPSPLIFKDEDTNSTNNSSDIPRFQTFGKSRFQKASQSQKGPHCGRKTWQSKQWYSGIQEQEDDDEEEEFINPESIFEAMFGGSHRFTSSFSSWENFRNSRYGKSSYSSRFTGESRRRRAKGRDYFSETDADESDSNFNTFVGSSVNRAALGLPKTGPLNLEDVKIAFRAAALKWHPDRHTGPSQDTASEKFKLCVNAYHSLCSDLRAN